MFIKTAAVMVAIFLSLALLALTVIVAWVAWKALVWAWHYLKGPFIKRFCSRYGIEMKLFGAVPVAFFGTVSVCSLGVSIAGAVLTYRDPDISWLDLQTPWLFAVPIGCILFALSLWVFWTLADKLNKWGKANYVHPRKKAA
jgi:hypothetical protein